MSSLSSSSSGHGEDVLTPPSSAYTTVTAPSAASSTNPTSRILIRVEDNKLVPIDASPFPPCQAISTYMASKFDEKQEAIAYSGKHISPALREFYWEEFKKRYAWDPLDEEAIKSCWWQNVKTQYIKHVHGWRHSKDKKPDCVNQENWELFKKVHTKKDETFVNARSKQVNDCMEELASSASQPLDDDLEPPSIDIDGLYFEAAGREKKRRVYGLGSRAVSFYPTSFQSRKTLYSSKVTAVAAQVKELVQQELADKQAEMDRKIAESNAQIERIQQMEEQMRRFMKQMGFAPEFHGSGYSAS